jgi:hypothetical protein
MLVEAPKFSKFLHGMSLLYPAQIQNTPPWFVPEKIGSSLSVSGFRLLRSPMHVLFNGPPTAAVAMRPATIQEMSASLDLSRSQLFPEDINTSDIQAPQGWREQQSEPTGGGKNCNVYDTIDRPYSGPNVMLICRFCFVG